MTHSATAALEQAAILCELKQGDEIIMPSYTFVATANAVALRGAVPVFVDVLPEDVTINVNAVEAAVTEKTKAVIVVHYAGMPCDMDPIMALAKRHNLYVIEDAAQALLSTYKGRHLETIGLRLLFFHYTVSSLQTWTYVTLILPRSSLLRRLISSWKVIGRTLLDTALTRSRCCARQRGT